MRNCRIVRRFCWFSILLRLFCIHPIRRPTSKNHEFSYVGKYGHRHWSPADYMTSVVITSNLIPSHPSIAMINDTVKSIQYLKGLEPDAPVVFAVDGLNTHQSEDERKRFFGYLSALRTEFHKVNHIMVVANRSIQQAGIMRKAVESVQTRFMYVLQHDLIFSKVINHTSVIKSMIENPNVLKIVRFNKRRNLPINTDNGPCFAENTTVDHVNGLYFTRTPGWSDNNHLTTKEYYLYHYKRQLLRNGRIPRFVEWFMMPIAQKNCSEWGPFLYGEPGTGPYLKHVDGRKSATYTSL